MRQLVLIFAIVATVACALTPPACAANTPAFLGAALGKPPPFLAGQGVLVQAIAPGSPAEYAGLLSNDIIVKVDGNRFSQASAMREYVESRKPGHVLKLDIMRWSTGGWYPIGIRATLIARPTAYGSASGGAAPSGFDSAAPAGPATATAPATATVRVNPQWEQRQQQISQATDASIMQDYRNFMAAQSHEYETRTHQMDQSFKSMDDIINGTAHYVDNDTGRRYDLTNQYTYQWLGPNGAHVGTNADMPPPGSGWRKLQLVPPQ
jgi:hypothetical protein